MVQVAHRLVPPVRRRSANERLEEAARVYDRLQQVAFYRGEGLPIFYCGVRTLNVAELVAPSPELATAYANAHAVAGVVPVRWLAESYLQKGVEALRERPDPVIESYLLTLTGVYRLGCAQWDAARLALERALALSKDLGFARRAEEVAGALAELGFLQGDHAAAIRLSTDQLESGARGDAQTQCWGLLGRAQAYLATEHVDLARADVERAIALLPMLGRPEQIWAYGLRARAALHAGDFGAARAAAERAARRITEAPPVAHYCLEAYAAVSEFAIAALARERTRAARLRAERACRAEGDAARVFPIAEPKWLFYTGALQWLGKKPKHARETWVRALACAEVLDMPDVARLARHVLRLATRQPGEGRARRATRLAELDAFFAAGIRLPRPAR
jgi:hypothetical protein